MASTRRFNRYAKYTSYASSRAFSHWRCINGRTECIAMHSRIIQEDIADSTRGRELVETKVRLARTALLSSISRISLIPNSMDAPVILMYYAILMCTNVHTHQMLISYVRFALCSSLKLRQIVSILYLFFRFVLN